MVGGLARNISQLNPPPDEGELITSNLIESPTSFDLKTEQREKNIFVMGDRVCL